MEDSQHSLNFGFWPLIGLWYLFAFLAIGVAGMMSWYTGRAVPVALMIPLAVGFLLMFVITLLAGASWCLRRLRIR